MFTFTFIYLVCDMLVPLIETLPAFTVTLNVSEAR